tara:strand:- start:447 stop:1211 length:765 start_codon:yes stop_codon:yes gene_type:complete
MKIILITQDDPFYISKNLHYFFNILPKSIKVVGCVINNASPFGKKKTFYEKIKKTYAVFGFKFFIYYSLKYAGSKLNKKNNLRYLLSKNKIPEIILNKSINHKESIEKIKVFNPDILVSVLANEIFKNKLINLAPKGCINLHTSLLPKYRGLMPSFWVLKNNEKYTGVSVFYVDEGIDSGPIIIQKRITIGDMTHEKLIKYTKKIGMNIICEALELIQKNKVNLMNNNDSSKTYFTFPKREDVNEFYRIGKKFY